MHCFSGTSLTLIFIIWRFFTVNAQLFGSNCSTLSTFKSTAFPVYCKIENEQCKNTSKVTAAVPKDKTTGNGWFLYQDSQSNKTKIGLNVTWGPNHDSSMSDVDGYRINVYRIGNSNDKNLFNNSFYCLETKLIYPYHAGATFHFEYKSGSASQNIKPGQEILVNVQNIPGPLEDTDDQSLLMEINIPECSDAMMKDIYLCQDKLSGSASVNCADETANLTYHVPEYSKAAAKYKHAYLHVCENIAPYNCPSKKGYDELPLDGFVLWNFSSYHYLTKNYTFKILGVKENDRWGIEQHAVNINFEECQQFEIPTQSLSLSLLIVLPLLGLLSLVVCLLLLRRRKSLKEWIDNNPDVVNAGKVIDSKIDPSIEENLIALEEKLSKQSKEEVKVYIIFVDDHPKHKEIILKFAGFLKADLQLDIIFELYNRQEIYGSPADWMEKSLAKADKVIVIWSPGASKRWDQYNSRDDVHEDMFTPVLKKIKRDLFYEKNKSKYFFTYFDYCSKDVIPQVFQDDAYYHFQLMKQFEELYFQLKGVEKFMPGLEIREEKVAFDCFFDPKINKFGPALERAINEMAAFVEDNPKWYECSLEQSHAYTQPCNSAAGCASDLNTSVVLKNSLEIVPPPSLSGYIQSDSGRNVGDENVACPFVEISPKETEEMDKVCVSIEPLKLSADLRSKNIGLQDLTSQQRALAEKSDIINNQHIPRQLCENDTGFEPQSERQFTNELIKVGPSAVSANSGYVNEERNNVLDSGINSGDVSLDLGSNFSISDDGVDVQPEEDTERSRSCPAAKNDVQKSSLNFVPLDMHNDPMTTLMLINGLASL
ncbi:interleukin-17 receptor A-like [Clavelina lepadiformis]|uniref:interleukin-17 receptor A-like n=1 Tax=Clavelina lepadiformis TaxID=159417 RepID=UPI0040411BF9